MIDDETLLAYVDDERECSRHEEIARAIESDVSLAKRVQVFVESREWTYNALRHIPEEPVPDRLVNLIRRHQPAPPAFAKWWAMAASLAALLIGGIAGFAIGGESSQQSVQPPWLPPSLLQALSNERSGAVVPGAGGEIMVTMSFRDARGRLCREYRVARPNKPLSGVACRLGTTGWKVELVVPEAVVAEAVDLESYAPAAGPDVPLAAFMEAMVEQVLSPAMEQKLIDIQWQE